MFKRILLSLLLGLAALSASAQIAGHLGVPGAQMVYSSFGPITGLPANHQYPFSLVRPDGTVEPMTSTLLLKQTLVYLDVVVIVYRPGGAVSWPESGEIYLGDVDASQRSRPLQDQAPLLRYTMPANESRLVLRVSLAAGRAYGGYRQPVAVHYGPAGIDMNVRANGYVLAN